MILRMNALRGWRVLAKDGPLGVLNDLYFDDRGWMARYVAIDNGERNPGARVLVPAAAATLAGERTVALRLARAQARPGTRLHADPHLVSAREMSGYRIEAPRIEAPGIEAPSYGPFGQVEDLLIGVDWSLAGMVASTRDWLLPGRKVELAAGLVVSIDRAGRVLRVNPRRRLSETRA